MCLLAAAVLLLTTLVLPGLSKDTWWLPDVNDDSLPVRTSTMSRVWGWRDCAMPAVKGACKL